MDIILNISKAIEVIGHQKIREGEYRPSIYNISLPQDDKILVYNLFTRGMLCLTQEEFEVASATCSGCSSELSELQTYLIENYYFVPSEMDEQKSYLEVNELIHTMDFRRHIRSYTVLTTTACNARCFYCFEKDFVPVSMDAKTAHDLAQYMLKNVGKEPLKIHWFGGEPLCNVAVMDQISAELREHGQEFNSHITSNGYAFTEELVLRAKNDWNVRFVQITLDGMEEEHNRRKNFKANQDNPFLRTIENIHLLLKHEITVSVRINFDPHNIESVRELLAYLKNEFAGEKRLVVYTAKIFDDCGSWKSGHTSEQAKMMNETHDEFTGFLADNNMSHPKARTNGYKYYHCGSNNVHHRTVSPEGKFLLCHNLSDTEGFGSIYDGITDQDLYHRWVINSEVAEKCNGCPLLPECTPFSMCPNILNNCLEERKFNVLKSMVERYRKYLKYLEKEK